MRAQIQSIHLSLSSRRKGERRIGLRDGQQVSRLINPTRTQQQRHEVAVNMARPLKPESFGQHAPPSVSADTALKGSSAALQGAFDENSSAARMVVKHCKNGCHATPKVLSFRALPGGCLTPMCHSLILRPKQAHYATRSTTWIKLAGAVGFEPTVHGTKNRCLTTWPRPNLRAI